MKILFRGNWEGPGFIRNALHFGMKWNYSGWIWFYAWKNWLKLIFVFFDRSTSVNKQNYLYRGPRILWFWTSCSWTGLEKKKSDSMKYTGCLTTSTIFFSNSRSLERPGLIRDLRVCGRGDASTPSFGIRHTTLLFRFHWKYCGYLFLSNCYESTTSFLQPCGPNHSIWATFWDQL